MHSSPLSPLAPSEPEQEQENALFEYFLNDPSLVYEAPYFAFRKGFELKWSQVDSFIDSIKRERGAGRYRVELWTEGIGLKLKMVGQMHERAANLTQRFSGQFPDEHKLECKLVYDGCGRVKKVLSNGTLQGKEPDASWSAYSLEHSVDDPQAPAPATKPTVIVECGRSDSDGKVALDGNWWGHERGEREDLNDHTNLVITISVNVGKNRSETPQIKIRTLVHDRYEHYLPSIFTVLKRYPSEKLIVIDEFEWKVDATNPSDINRPFHLPAFLFYRQMNHLLVSRTSPHPPPLGTLDTGTTMVDSRLLVTMDSKALHYYGVIVGQAARD